ncbi:DUF1566 domain-containing protein [Paucibacter sp. Y2R2-4]|uniref:Lcl C-terminal domain-containing protein n=1 Tax=Paucibacter sp. Y2R2-4 TaxID=2893553 RepID=UPI0021E4CD1C|nr:DUF1566 domain-containing protein [Paucibacter sp. Y2R2-4]MCV2350446.1 DUF1566 domain-containing protein [Paucibacter sp. Y2R2-4]
MRALKIWAAAAAIVALTGTAQAALVNLANGTVKDTNTNLIWLADWNVNGAADWGSQRAWAEGFSFAGSTDWRLPEISEYAALFTAYGNLRAEANFRNVQYDHYWSGTEVAPGLVAFEFHPDYGMQNTMFQISERYAVAVRPDDLTASVPEPQSLALALLALGATLVARRRRSH